MSNFENGIDFNAPDVQKSVFDTTQANLGSYGSLLKGQMPLDIADRMAIDDQFGSNAADRIVNLTAELLTADPRGVLYAGGVCALSTRESRMLGMEAATEDAVTGRKLLIRSPDDLEQLQDVVSLAQIVETVGLTPYRTSIVLEDVLWADKVANRLQFVGEAEASIAGAGLVQARNRRTEAAVNNLRQYLFGNDVEPVVPIIDQDILEQLTEETDRMITDIGLEPIDDPYRVVYAGMYSYVWRNILVDAGVVRDDQTMAIYEPSKHIGREGTEYSDISKFKAALVRNAPFMQAGSPGEKLGLMAYLEPRDPNGRRFRDAVPLALMPNSLNYRDFDFSRFPVVPKKKDDLLAEYSEFTFLDDLSSTSLMKNPAFLWGLAYPLSKETQPLMSEMKSIGSLYKSETREKLGAICDGNERRQAAETIRKSYSDWMKEAAERLIEELEEMSKTMFGVNDEVK
ncbi:MAG: hypothetical protein QG593_340 [Patescibacteria group bacterium]|jgi:hypothetical protein|nr:hypothetical protein [Patescibacteria group bacterium]